MNFNDQIRRFALGIFSREEERGISKLFWEEDSLSEIKEALRNEWEMQSDYTEKDLTFLLHKLHYRMNSESAAKTIKRRGRFMRWAIEIAAAVILALVLTGTTLYLLQDEKTGIAYAELQAPKNARVQFRLPDGTDGWLNSGATLKYPLDFQQKREVTLWGEGFFSVTKRADGAPFTVLANDAKIVVWGTRFNVNAEDNGRMAEVVLEEGKVEFTYRAGARNRSVMLDPGQMLVYDGKQKQHTVTNTNSADYTQWINGRFVVRGESVANFAKQFGRRFNMDIVMIDKRLENMNFRATFENESPEEIIRLLELIVPISCQVEERKLLADGTFTKKRITIQYNNKRVKEHDGIYE